MIEPEGNYDVFINYSYLGKFDHDLTGLPNPGIMVNNGNHPQKALIQVSEIL